MSLHDVTLSIDNPHKCDTDGTISFNGHCEGCGETLTISVNESGWVAVEECAFCIADAKSTQIMECASESSQVRGMYFAD